MSIFTTIGKAIGIGPTPKPAPSPSSPTVTTKPADASVTPKQRLTGVIGIIPDTMIAAIVVYDLGDGKLTTASIGMTGLPVIDRLGAAIQSEAQALAAASKPAN